MKILTENYYVDGHQSARTEEVPEYEGDPDDQDALREHLHPYTGDGHGLTVAALTGKTPNSYHTITILAAAQSVLVGRVLEWD